MPLFKTPPRIQMYAPPVVVGVPFRVEVVLDCRAPVPVEWIDVRINGELRYDMPNQYSDHATSDSVRTQLWSMRIVVLREKVELAPPDPSIEAQLRIPPGLPGAYRGPRLSIRWRLTTQVSIPWWPDSRRFADLPVRGHHPGPLVPAPPMLFATDPRGPAGRAPYAELSLASTVVRAGDSLRGYISLANTAPAAYRRIDLSLRQHFAFANFSDFFRRESEPVATIILRPRQGDGQPIPFELPVPATLIPAFSQRRMRLAWQLCCVVHVPGHAARKIFIDIDVAPPDAPVSSSDHTPSLALIGSERRALAWSQAATDTGFDHEAGMLVRRRERYTLTLALESGAGRGTRLVADARVVEIDIGLHAKDGRLRCRDPEHSRLVAEATDALTQRHHILDADDRRLRYEVPDGGTRRQALVALARWLEALVIALLDARAQLLAPASLAHLQPAFERAAAMLGGILVPAGMDVWGRRDDLPFSLESRWDGADRYCSTVLTVGTLLPIDSRHHGHFVPDRWPEAPPRGLEELLDGAIGLEIGPHGIEIHFPATPADEAEDIRIEPLVERLEALIAIGRRLSMRDGVYR